MYKLISALIGVLITIMILFNGVLSQSMGNYTAAVIIHFTGFILISLVVLFKKNRIRLDRSIPILMYGGGALGVFTILFNNVSFTYLGASLTLALGLLGQSITSIFLDHFGLLGMQVVKLRKEKLVGLIIIAVGITIMTLY